jgi:hypothetical protein
MRKPGHPSVRCSYGSPGKSIASHLADIRLAEKFGIGKYGCERLAEIMGNMGDDPV